VIESFALMPSVRLSLAAAVRDNGAVVEAYEVAVIDVRLGNRTADRVMANSTSHDFTGLPSGRNWTVTVTAINKIGSSVPVTAPGVHSTLDVPLQCDAPAQRTPPLDGMPTATTLHVVWQAPFDNGAAILQYDLRITDASTLETVTVVVQHTAGQTSYEYIKTGLFPGSSHSFSVAAVNSIGQGPFSADRQLVTALDVPGTPTAPYLIAETSSSIVVGLNNEPYDGGIAINHHNVSVAFGSEEQTLQVSTSVLEFTINPRNPFAT
jgi:predicted phage tail protein